MIEQLNFNLILHKLGVHLDSLKPRLLTLNIPLYLTILMWPRKGSLMKTQTRILDNRLYYTRKIELHRKGKKSRTVWITPILIYGI